jgi:predicted NBD/HSP70 family sugar kinase
VAERLPGTPRVLRAINDRSALELLFEHGALSRSQLVELTGLSKPTAAELLSRLVADGLVVTAGTTTGSRGPNAQLYSINHDLGFVAGVNAEEDRVTAAVADIAGQVVAEAAVEVDLTAGASPIPSIRRAVRDAARRAKTPKSSLKHVVVGVAGAYDPHTDSVIYAGHLPGWQSEGIVDKLRHALGVPLTIENDANLAAVGERTRGSARDVDTFALLWVGRGLGLAVELGGRLYQGAKGGAGEVGYIPVGGRSVTFQDSVGSRAVLELARRHGLVGATAEDVVALAAAEGSTHRPFLMELAERLATGVATIVAVLDPPLVVLAGGTCQAGGPVLVELTQAELSRISPFNTPLTVTGVSGSSVLVGAVDSAVAQARSVLFGGATSDEWMPMPPPDVASA